MSGHGHLKFLGLNFPEAIEQKYDCLSFAVSYEPPYKSFKNYLIN